MDAYLPEPRSEGEYNILLNFVTNSVGYGYQFWLGATDSANEGTWVWQSDGEVMSFDNWDPYETNTENKNCFYMYTSDGFWRYCNCIWRQSIICQKKFEGNVHGCVCVDRLK